MPDPPLHITIRYRKSFEVTVNSILECTSLYIGDAQHADLVPIDWIVNAEYINGISGNVCVIRNDELLDTIGKQHQEHVGLLYFILEKDTVVLIIKNDIDYTVVYEK
jgi:hypothetical protein